ncbi:MAG: hypothetical protein PVH17_05675 [Anaerolineae bacterium]|jgi:hypothetical protein
MTESRHRAESRTPVVAAQALFVMNAVFWILLGVSSVSRLENNAGLAWLIAVLMLANAGVMAWIGWGLGKEPKPFYYLAIPVLAVNILLTVTDEFGLFDLIALLMDVVLLMLLVVTRSRYLSARHGHVRKADISTREVMER